MNPAKNEAFWLRTIIWTKKGNVLSIPIKVQVNLNPLYKGYLHHRFRKLIAQSNNFILPIDWTYENSVLKINYPVECFNSIINQECSPLLYSKKSFSPE